ncbi:MAG: alpha/beta hydrolase, partial [Alphaproteobacteria bacterium]
LAIQGEDDEYGTMAQVDAIAAQVSGPHQCLKLPDCGHEPHREQEAVVLEATTAFIRERML